LYKWCESNKYFSRQEEDEKPSHLLWDGHGGGKLFVPKNKEHEFLCKYIDEHNGGGKLYIIEQRSNVYKFMIDLDIEDDHYWKCDEIETIVKHIQGVINMFYDTKNNFCICCISPSKIKNGNVFTDIHLVWPSIPTCNKHALIVRRGMLNKLAGVRVGCRKIEDVFDESIYTKNGIRMLFSDKISNGAPENRESRVLFVYDSKINVDYTNRLMNNKLDALIETSIRFVRGSIPLEIIIPDWSYDVATKIMLDDTIGGEKISSKFLGMASDQDYVVINNYINVMMPRQYHGKVKEMRRYPDDNILIIMNSRYCLNLCGNHKSCGVFLFACPYGIYQRCLCPCNKLRKHGLCKNYRSKCFQFGDEVVKMLFPKHKPFNRVTNFKNNFKNDIDKMFSDLLVLNQ
jgi:hypothetical protein